MNKIRIIYLAVVISLLGTFYLAGSNGYRILSVFASSAVTHTGPNGVHHK